MIRIFPIVCTTALLATGCYAYYPTARGSAPVGRPVELALTDSGAVVLAAKIGPAVEAISGTLVGDSAGTYVLSVRGTRQRSGEEAGWKGERLEIARPLVASVGERRFSPGRTAMFAFSGTAALIGAVEAFRGAGGSNFPGKSPGPIPTPK